MTEDAEITEEIVTLYPTGRAHIQGDPLVGSPPEIITEVNAAAAAAMLAYQPPAFSHTPTPYSVGLEEAGIPHGSIRTYTGTFTPSAEPTDIVVSIDSKPSGDPPAEEAPADETVIADLGGEG